MTLKLYTTLNKIKFLSKSYLLKFLFIAFLGTHLPIIGLVYVMFLTSIELSPINALLIVLVMTLIGTAFTLYVLTGLLQPFKEAEKSLREFNEKGILPKLPQHYTDEIGSLFNNIQLTIEKLNRLIEEKKDFTMLISHDLRSPVNKSISLLSLLKIEDDEQTRMDIINKIESSLNEQLGLLEELLILFESQYTVSESLEKEEFPFNKLIEDTLKKVDYRLKEKQLKVNYENTDKLIKINEKLFKHVLLNILTNAIKFSYDNSQIDITLKSDSNFDIIEIKDYGKGFEPHVAEKIFEKFTRFGQKGVKGEKSTGLGLYLTKQIILNHGGSISAVSEGADKGAKFIIHLPK